MTGHDHHFSFGYAYFMILTIVEVCTLNTIVIMWDWYDGEDDTVYRMTG